jgi:hypothetical protein
MIKIQVFRQVVEYGLNSEGKQVATKNMEVTDVIESSSNAAIAGFLRAKADELDPKKRPYRGTDND